MVNVVDLVICEVVVVDIDVDGNVNTDVIVDFDDMRQFSISFIQGIQKEQTV